MFVAALSGYDQCLVEDKTAVRRCLPRWAGGSLGTRYMLTPASARIESNARGVGAVRVHHESDLVQTIVHHLIPEQDGSVQRKAGGQAGSRLFPGLHRCARRLQRRVEILCQQIPRAQSNRRPGDIHPLYQRHRHQLAEDHHAKRARHDYSNQPDHLNPMTAEAHMEDSHRALHKVITTWRRSNPTSLPLRDTQLHFQGVSSAKGFRSPAPVRYRPRWTAAGSEGWFGGETPIGGNEILASALGGFLPLFQNKEWALTWHAFYLPTRFEVGVSADSRYFDCLLIQADVSVPSWAAFANCNFPSHPAYPILPSPGQAIPLTPPHLPHPLHLTPPHTHNT